MPRAQRHEANHKVAQQGRAQGTSPDEPFPGETDPVVQRVGSSALNGPVIVMFFGVLTFCFAKASALPGIAALFTGHASGQTSDAAAPRLPEWIPVLLVLSSASLLAFLAVGALVRRKRRAAEEVIPPATGNRSKTRKKSAAAAPVTAKGAATELWSKPFLITRQEDRPSAIQSFRIRRDEKASAAARAAAAERVLAVVPRRSQPGLDSTPTLPIHPQVRRRDPRLGLPPALAAALQKQVAAGPRLRPAAAPDTSAAAGASF